MIAQPLRPNADSLNAHVQAQDPRDVRGNLFEQFQPLAAERAERVGEPGGVTLGVRRIPHRPALNGVASPDEYDWNFLRLLLHGAKCHQMCRDNHVRRGLHQLGRENPCLSVVSASPFAPRIYCSRGGIGRRNGTAILSSARRLFDPLGQFFVTHRDFAHRAPHFRVGR